MQGFLEGTKFLFKIIFDMDILLKWLIKVRDYLHGFLEITRIETPRYSFIIEKFDITYHDASIA